MSKQKEEPKMWSGANIVSTSNYWDLEQDVSIGFNRLKAKIFNLIEASVINKEQQEALKGLVRGFANDEYAIVMENMRYTAKSAGFIDGKGETCLPISAEPLENRGLEEPIN